MRTCAKMHCGADPVATITLRYADKVVVVDELVARRDPNLLDLCSEHVERLTAPRGWSVRDVREPSSVLSS